MAETNEKALEASGELLKQKAVVLYEPAIRFGNCFIRADVLIKQDNEFELIEVKAKSFDSANPSMRGARGGIATSWLPYLQDLAFQTWVVRSAFPEAKVKAFLMMPDKSKVAEHDGVNQMFKIDGKSNITTMIPPGLDGEQIAKSLLAKVDVTELVDSILDAEVEYPGGADLLPELAANWAEKYANDERIPPQIGSQCKPCQFKPDPDGEQKSGWLECWQDVTHLSQKTLIDDCVLDLYDYRKKQSLIDQGVYLISKVQREDLAKKGFSDEIGPEGLELAQRQWMQVQGLQGDSLEQGFYLNTTLIHNESQQWKFPYHLIDFETASVALPFFNGMKPYEQVAFQFSHHIIERDGSVRHANEFLCATPGEFPNFKFVRALKKALDSDDGTVFMWWPHENTILTRISQQLLSSQEQDREELIGFISSLTRGGNREMYDLCKKLAAKAYYHPSTKGSSSLKKVLPAVVSASPQLRDRYSKPIYGAPNGIPSKNFSSPDGMAWLDMDDPAPDPYRKLKKIAKGLLPEGIDEDEGSVIAEGGAAATAYARLQFESLDDESRTRIQSALLRYCELDTLAMVMVLEAFLPTNAKQHS